MISSKLLKDIDKYDANYPYVAAARRMSNFGHTLRAGSIVEYMIIKGEGKISDCVRLPNEVNITSLDMDYYIEKQIIASTIHLFELFGVTKEDILSEHDQSKLEDFM